ncbi:MAG: hypothetical protein K2O65_11195 [Lachnospiraceae bacterium]|nr:hypothetical protein [Lachnospiraceae bacterium]
MTGQVTLVYSYSGTMADGTAYLVQSSCTANAGNYALTVTFAKTIRAVDKEKLSKGIEQITVKVKIGGKEIDPENYEIDYAGTNHSMGTATMNVKGKNEYVGSKSVTFKITGMPINVKTIEVKAYDMNHSDEKEWKAYMPYTGRGVTQNKVTLTAKVTSDNQNAGKLAYGEHYTITYKDNVKKGTATMTFAAKPESGYSGRFKKTFKITAQGLSKDRLIVLTQAGNGAAAEAVYCKSGATLPFLIINETGMALREGTDYAVKYKNNNAVTTVQTA